MHKVPVITMRPLILDIINEESQVGRNPNWLDGTKIHTQDGSAGIFVGDFEWLVRNTSHIV